MTRSGGAGGAPPVGSGGAGTAGGGTGGSAGTGAGGLDGRATGGAGQTGGTVGSNGTGGAGNVGDTGGVGVAAGGRGAGGAGGAGGTSSCLSSPTVPCTCADYCTNLGLVCSSLAYFPLDDRGNDDCVTTCESLSWTAGELASPTREDTLACRVSTTEPPGSPGRCKRKSPTGGGFCGSRCGVYCDAMAKNCGDPSVNPFQGGGDCMSACAAYGMTWPDELLVKSGNVGGCFLYWAGQAARMTGPAKKVACDNAGLGSPACTQ